MTGDINRKLCNWRTSRNTNEIILLCKKEKENLAATAVPVVNISSPKIEAILLVSSTVEVFQNKYLLCADSE
jgi:hypothetical protein